MQYSLKFKVNDSVFLKDPNETELGRQIISRAIPLIKNLGFEEFTFKKLANEIDCTEASIYRYFENKHKLLLYIISLYWNYMEYQVTMTPSDRDPSQRILDIIDLLTEEPKAYPVEFEIDTKSLLDIVITESSKTYLIKKVDEINKLKVFQPYKDLCHHIADLIKQVDPDYPFAHSLASTIVETAHDQFYFYRYLPSLTDGKENQDEQKYVRQYLYHLISKVLKIK
mgnify:CR=1 FL=1